MEDKNRLARALAFFLITGTKARLHIDTRVAMLPFTRIEPYHCPILNLDLHREVLTDEGHQIARTSRFWKAHEHMLLLGYLLRSDLPQRSSFLHYQKIDANGRKLSGYVTARGDANVQDESATCYQIVRAAKFINK